MISYSKHITEGYKTVVVPFRRLTKVVRSKFNYTAGTFKDGYRNKENYLNRSNVLILDIDDGVSIEEAKEIFKDYMNIIATTKSHQKEKNGIVCDRFRVIIPTSSEVTLNKDEYSLMMEEVYKKYPFVDTVCKDASRFYFPSETSIVKFNNGENAFNWKPFWEKAKEDEEERIRLIEFRKNFSGYRKPMYEYDTEEKIDYIRKICKTEKILQLLKYDERFVSGKRNNYLYSVACYFMNLGMSDDEVKDNVEWINNQGDSIPHNELSKTIFKSLRLL